MLNYRQSGFGGQVVQWRTHEWAESGLLIMWPLLLFIFLACFGGRGVTGEEETLSRSVRDYGGSAEYRQWEALASRRAAVSSALAAVDVKYNELVNELYPLAESVRRSIRIETRKSYMRAWTYGLTTIGASFFLIKVTVEASAGGGPPLTRSEELAVYSQLAFAYGYGAPYLVDGQLGPADPGCGGSDLMDGLGPALTTDFFGNRYGALEAADGTVTPRALVDTAHHPSLTRMEIAEHLNSGRRAASCVVGSDSGAELAAKVDALEALANQRLDLTQKLMSNLERESGLSEKLGYGLPEAVPIDYNSVYY